MPSIPASQLVSTQPGVVSAGGSPLSLNSVFLTNATAAPIGSVVEFVTQAAVAAYFGPNSDEALLAAVYFNGFTGSTIKPGKLMFYQYASSAVAAYLRGLSNGLTLAQVNAIIPGVVTASIATTVLTVTAVTSGTVVDGMLLTGTGVSAGTRVVAQLTGTAGGIGTYTVSISQTTSSTTITGAYDMSVTINGVAKSFATVNLSAAASLSAAATALGTALSLSGGQTCTYSSQFGAFIVTSGTTGAASTITLATGLAATTLGLGTGATLSQGSAVATEAGAMAEIANLTQNWATFMTVWEPNLASKLLFAAWVTAQSQRYAYVAWDSDVANTTGTNAAGFGALVNAGSYDGVVPIYLSADKAAFFCGTTASINFAVTNGRITYAFKGQSGLTADVTDATVAANLIANGYNFYGAYATANQQFTMFQPGQISGVWLWADSYINQIYFNSQLQLAGMTMLATINSLPYNNDGYTTLRDTYGTPIQDAINFGTIRLGVPLSDAQAAAVNAAAGVTIDQVITNTGFYLQINPATAQQRAARESPPSSLWYADGQSIQKLNLASIDVQ